MNFICEAVSRTPPHPRLKNVIDFKDIFKISNRMKKAERHYLVQYNYCEGFAQGTFSFIMFIQMFMLIVWFRQVSGRFFLCQLTIFCEGGWLNSHAFNYQKKHIY